MRPGADRRGRGGFALIETMIAFSIAILALLGFSQAIVSWMRASDTDDEVRLATEAARQVMENIQGAEFRDVFRLYNSVAGDDPGPDPAPGTGFAVPGLTARSGDPDGFVGRVIIPESVDVMGVAHVREDIQNSSLGMPRDLDGSGAVDAGDHEGDYLILPVVVRVEWEGTSKRSYVEFRTLLSGF